MPNKIDISLKGFTAENAQLDDAGFTLQNSSQNPHSAVSGEVVCMTDLQFTSRNDDIEIFLETTQGIVSFKSELYGMYSLRSPYTGPIRIFIDGNSRNSSTGIIMFYGFSGHETKEMPLTAQVFRVANGAVRETSSIGPYIKIDNQGAVASAAGQVTGLASFTWQFAGDGPMPWLETSQGRVALGSAADSAGADLVHSFNPPYTGPFSVSLDKSQSDVFSRVVFIRRLRIVA